MESRYGAAPPLPASAPRPDAAQAQSVSALKAAVAARLGSLSPGVYAHLYALGDAESRLANGRDSRGWKLSDGEKERLQRTLSEGKAKLAKLLRGEAVHFAAEADPLERCGRFVAAFADADGEWRTVHGVHVHLGADGRIDKGPAHLVGKRHAEVAVAEATAAAKGGGGGGAGGKETKNTLPGANKKVEKAPAVKGEMAAARREGKGKEAKIVLADGSPAPAHVKPAMVPPDWTDVRIGLDPEADVLVQARDNKGRPKTVYADKFHLRNAALKFARTQAGLEERANLIAENRRNLDGPDPKTREAAACTWLMQEQATRPGSDNDTGGKVKAYGATTLRAEHVEEGPDGVRLHFVGKEGVEHNHLIKDPELAKELVRRKRTAGERGGKLFGVDYDKVSAYAKTLDTGRFTPKDWRTIRANALAIGHINSIPPPKSVKEYKAAVKAVAERVSSVLGNRPAQALKSYIDPAVFSAWRANANA